MTLRILALLTLFGLTACASTAPSGVLVSDRAKHVGGSLFLEPAGDDGFVLILDGRITPETSYAFQRMVQIADINSLVIAQSVGGDLFAAHQIGDVVSKNRIDTVVLALCYSACVDVFIAGDDRVISSVGTLGLHSASDAELGYEMDRAYWGRRGLGNVNEMAYQVAHKELWLIDADRARDLRLATDILR
ncbi:MAG: hypothetical protein AAFX45_03740 [Pseudomonadota bacterium]